MPLRVLFLIALFLIALIIHGVFLFIPELKSTLKPYPFDQNVYYVDGQVQFGGMLRSFFAI